ncbi:MAG: zinc-ribbon domain-containing protein [Oscillospiraceae bacterium]|nr:zinc-ribbon domain-containing protein [Oscillospiraceae bacterium]
MRTCRDYINLCQAKKNGSLTPWTVTAGSQKKVWWKCSLGHEWAYKRQVFGSCF